MEAEGGSVASHLSGPSAGGPFLAEVSPSLPYASPVVVWADPSLLYICFLLFFIGGGRFIGFIIKG